MNTIESDIMEEDDGNAYPSIECENYRNVDQLFILPELVDLLGKERSDVCIHNIIKFLPFLILQDARQAK
jgi:hypothetical protein